MTAWRLVGTMNDCNLEVPQERAVVLGRSVTCDLIVDDPTVSRRHAEIVPGGDGITVNDLGSSNGTFVNDARVGTALVMANDVVAFGTAAFRVMAVEPKPEAPAPETSVPEPEPEAPAPAPETPAPEPPSEAPAPAPVFERRRLVVLAGVFKGLAAAADADGGRRLADRAAAVEQTVAAHGGRLLGFAGGFAAVWDGTGPAAGRAAAAGLALAQDAPAGIPLGLGLHVGEAFAAGNAVIGDAVCHALRLAEGAEGGALLASQALVDALATPLTARPLESVYRIST